MVWRQIIAGIGIGAVIGAVIAIGSTFFISGVRTSELEIELGHLKGQINHLSERILKYNFDNNRIAQETERSIRSLENVRYQSNSLIVVQTETEVIVENIYKSLIAIRISWDETDPHGTGMGEDSFIHNSVIPRMRINQKFNDHTSVQIWAWGTSGALIDSCNLHLTINMVKILSPKNGDKVSAQTVVRGKSKINDAGNVWVLVHRKDLTYEWYPQAKPIIDKNGNWEVSIYLGTPEDIGHVFEIAAAVFNNEEEKRVLEKYIELGEKTGSWLPIKVPKTTSNIYVVNVIKTSHK